MRPTVDQELCIGCGLCAEIAPDVFEMGEDGLSHAVADVDDGNRESVQEAVDSCPVSAISL